MFMNTRWRSELIVCIVYQPFVLKQIRRFELQLHADQSSIMMVFRGLYWTLWMFSCIENIHNRLIVPEQSLTEDESSVNTISLPHAVQVQGKDHQLPELINGAVGGSVKFTPNNPPSTAIDIINWQFGTTIILTGNPDSPFVASAYRDRVSFDKNTLALELRNLKLEDSGSYSLTVVPSSGDQVRGETALQVFEQSLAEDESSVNTISLPHAVQVQGQNVDRDLQIPELTNEVVGGSVKFIPNNPPSTAIKVVQWKFGTTGILTGPPDSPLIVSTYRNRISFDKNTLSLELRNLKLEDSGSYSLIALDSGANQLRGETSLQVFEENVDEDLQLPELTTGGVGGHVMFIPNKIPSTAIDVIIWQFGTTIILTGNPDSPSVTSAYRDRVSFDKSTLSLELRNLKLEDSGSYSLTLLTSSGDQLRGETLLHVFDYIHDVILIGPEEALIERESSANITSKGSGTITSVQWMKDNSPLSSSSRIIFSSDNRSVSISPVERSDTGEYQCTYSNPVSSETAKLTLIINYGPDGVSIRGPDVVDSGVRVSLSCSAKSEPSASFSWTFNGLDTGVTSDTLTVDKTDFTDSGEYICTAFNRITNRRESQKHMLLVQGKDHQLPELINGAVGESVKFTPNNPPSTAIDIINWQFGTTIILTGNPDSPVVASAYRDRVSFDKNTLALELRNLKLEDSGSYSLTVVLSSGDQVRGETTLQVFETVALDDFSTSGATGQH
ncbi:hemicentin-1 isoform X2 [Danio rerio]|uniref:Hemicentin-1 isoform X2 n=1 Tax=Danio rerio TaxID=7955 RepID=A0AC58HJ70_DANRE